MTDKTLKNNVDNETIGSIPTTSQGEVQRPGFHALPALRSDVGAKLANGNGKIGGCGVSSGIGTVVGGVMSGIGSSVGAMMGDIVEKIESNGSLSSSSDRPDNNAFKDMRREDERLKTFEKWPVPFLSPHMLARNGFYFLGRGDEVRCAFCKVEIMRWVEGDDPTSDHKRWAPQCPFLRRQAIAGNVPIDPPSNDGRDECGTRVPPAASAAVPMPGPVHSKYASEAARLSTFKDWPRSLKQKPEELAEAGFYYTGQGDKTKCFYCDGGLKDWENEDVPWEQHARWFNRCAFVQLVKGKEYVQKVISEACAITDPKEATVEPAPVTNVAPKAPEATVEDETNENDRKLCIICYAEDRSICFVPCGHVVACAKCALATNKCPMCRRTFTNAVRLYYS